MKNVGCSGCDKTKEYCGIFGTTQTPNASKKTLIGISSLQHRGKESVGIISSDGDRPKKFGGMGRISEVFDEYDMNKLPGRQAISQTVYSTFGPERKRGDFYPPFAMRCDKGNISLAHNGTLINVDELMGLYNCRIDTDIDSECFLPGIEKADKGPIGEVVSQAIKPVRGSYSLIIMDDDVMVGVRDPFGIKPLSIGQGYRNDLKVLSSETVGIDATNARFLRDVNPGEVAVLLKSGEIRSYYPFGSYDELAQCIFEGIYFMRPSSLFFGKCSVGTFRQNLGKQLYREHPVDADIVLAVPNSGNHAALGFSEESGIKLQIGYDINYYVGRTFILPGQRKRESLVKQKLNVIKDVVQGKRVVVVDDSTVRGTTTKGRLNDLKKAGAKKIYLRVTCPPIKFPCYYGIDFPTEEELISNKYGQDEIAGILGIDGVGMISIDGLLDVAPHPKNDYCISCFDGSYRAGKPQSIKNYVKR